MKNQKIYIKEKKKSFKSCKLQWSFRLEKWGKKTWENPIVPIDKEKGTWIGSASMSALMATNGGEPVPIQARIPVLAKG